MITLEEKYKKEVLPEMKKIFGFKNDLAVPKLVKTVVNVGVGRALKDDKFLDYATDTLVRITGQKPVMTKAKKSISAFKIRAGMVVGMKVNLRGRRMYNFVYKLINVALPRVRDFRGLEAKSVDSRGNLTIGFAENLVFPEIKSDEVERLHGLEIVIDTNAKTHKEGLTLFKLLGFPIKS